jgi:DNA-binding beta-propeller fold protein YncE/mono/diheme cytochrome c family protein
MAAPPPNLPQVPVVAPHPPPAISGGTLAIAPDGATAVAADPDRDKVYVIDVAGNARRTISLPEGAEPGRVAFDAAGRAHVALRGSGHVAQIDTINATLLTQTAVCTHPRGLAYRAADDVILVACAGGDLVGLSAADHTERARSFLELDLRDVVITKDQKTLVSTFRSAQLIEVDAVGKALKRVKPATANGTRFTFDPQSGAASSQQVTLTPRIAWRTALSADGSAVMLHQRSQEEEVVVGPGGYGGGCASVTETTVTPISAEKIATAGWPLASATTAVDVSASPDGKWFAVASSGSSLQGMAAVQLYSSSEVTRPVPEGACMGPTAEASYNAQAVAVSFDSSGRLLVQSREPAQLEVFSLVTEEPLGDAGSPFWVQLRSDAIIPLDAESMRDTGHDLFHANVGGGLACASCHPEGRDDGHTWTFSGFGARRTQNFAGGLKNTAPFHWDGDMTSFQHLVDEVMTGRMGGFAVEARYADALLGWMDHLPSVKLPTRELEAAARGKVLFEANNCGSCHSGEKLTNNQSVDVGTGGAFQVPSLLGLGLRAPYMHDGCAKDLVARFDPACGGGDRHGTTSQLSPTQIADLATYLSTL